ncbi:MAG: FHA domain-containing protein, partial [Lachnospiraceae bacterium]|nr:FHA domain-containing protein [Lachnospiraceae bacterium]
YKTLIIIDNSKELTSYNQETIKRTLKQFIKGINREDKVAIAVTGETAQYLTDYDDSLNTQLNTIEKLEFIDVNAPGTDVLMEVILNWKESDVACRDIIFIGCRDISINSEYSEEELLFEVNSKQYPIYTLACMQDDNMLFKKEANILSRVSGGVCISTEDTTSDAEVDKQLADLLINAMRDKRSLDEYALSKEDNEADSVMAGDGEVDEEDAVDAEIIREEECVETDDYYSDNVIYETNEGETLYAVNPQLIYPLLSVIVVLCFIFVGVFIRHKKSEREEEEFYSEHKKKLVERTSREPFSDINTGETVCLNTNESEVDTGTRLLYQTKAGVEVTLEDRSNPTKFFRACIRDSVVIGRNDKLCDISINYDDSVSSRHCELSNREGEIYCRDLDSSNGTMINQQKVYQEIRVESGDILRIGRLSFFVQIVRDDYE